MHPPRPNPPSRRCTRHQADGTPCTNTTVRADRWCGHCEGYSLPRPSAFAVARPALTPQSGNTTRKSQEQKPPLEPDEAYDITITRNCRLQYSERHGCTEGEAETQIRSLLEHLLQHGACTRDQNGKWLMRSEGFLLVISADREAVLAYSTVHAERTFAQVKAGVPSRVSQKGKNNPPEWLYGQMESVPLPVRLTLTALKTYARRVKNLRLKNDNAADVLHDVHQALPKALATWSGTEDSCLLPDPSTGGRWALAQSTSADDPRPVVTAYLTGETS